MSFVRAGQLARETPYARPDDSLGLVAENLRESHYGTIPVFDSIEIDPRKLRGETLRGVVDERDLSRVLASANVASANVAQREVVRVGGEQIEYSKFTHNTPNQTQNGALHNADVSAATNAALTNGALYSLDETPKMVTQMTARDAMRDVGFVPSVFSLENALAALDRYDTNALPVIDGVQGFQGMISRSDVVAALGRAVRPPVVGGMATPLGVWLTTGSINAGVSNWGLLLSGATMAFCLTLAQVLITFALSFGNAQWANLFASGRLAAQYDSSNLFNILATIAETLLFLTLFRLLPLAGYHAAEHQTVWAIERGLPLRPEIVRQMPRAHPRCGTNLVALAMLITIIFKHLPSLDASYILVALVFVFFAWRSFGEALQNLFTTRPASPKQLESGIRAGRELLEKYQQQPHEMSSTGSRLLNSGILYSMAGAIGVVLLLEQLRVLAVNNWSQIAPFFGGM